MECNQDASRPRGLGRHQACFSGKHPAGRQGEAITPPEPALIEVAGLRARYPGQPPGLAALEGVSFRLERGERLLLVGPNGAGKSTLVRVLAGLMRPAAGEALIGGQPAREARSLVGVVGHATLLYDDLTAEENLRLYGALYDAPEPRNRARALLDAVGLLDRAGERVERLSRGQQQRVALARALVHDPPVLLLDEPDTGLDVTAFRYLERIALEGGRTLVLTTHNLAAGVRLGTRVAVLSRGRLVLLRPVAGEADAPELSALLAEQVSAPTR